MSIRIFLCAILIFSTQIACFLSRNVDQYTISSIFYNPETSYSGRIHRLLHGDYSPPEAAYSSGKHYPTYVYKPNCSIELVLQTWTNKNPQVPQFGEGELSIPTVSKTKSWQCYYRTFWLNNDDPLPSSNGSLPKERYLTTILYCPSMNSSSSNRKVSNTSRSNFGMCSLLNTAITKEGGNSVKLIFQVSSIETVLLRTAKSEQALQIGPVRLRAVSQRSRRHADLVTKYTTNTMDKTPVTLVEKASLLSGDVSEASAPVDKCAGDWANLTIVGRCFGLKTHTEYAQYKDIPLVKDANHCKSLCCELGKKCVTWQYWTEINLCKLGDAVRIGTEQAHTPFWCDSEPPITWSGYKVKRLSTGEADLSASTKQLTTQCFGLGAERMKTFTPPGLNAPQKTKMTVRDCEEECLATKNCGIWQAHERRGCYYTSASDVYCEPYIGGYVGGRRKCNDKCS